MLHTGKFVCTQTSNKLEETLNTIDLSEYILLIAQLHAAKRLFSVYMHLQLRKSRIYNIPSTDKARLKISPAPATPSELSSNMSTSTAQRDRNQWKKWD